MSLFPKTISRAGSCITTTTTTTTSLRGPLPLITAAVSSLDYWGNEERLDHSSPFLSFSVDQTVFL